MTVAEYMAQEMPHYAIGGTAALARVDGRLVEVES